jgi:hypothetical protein
MSPPFRSDPPKHQKNQDDDQHDAKHTYAGVTEAVAITAEAATEAAKQKDDKDNK